MTCSFSNSGDHQHHRRSIISREPRGLCDQRLHALECGENDRQRIWPLSYAAGLSSYKHRTWMGFFSFKAYSASVAFSPLCLLGNNKAIAALICSLLLLSTHIIIVSSQFPKDIIHGSSALQCALGALFIVLCK